MDAQCVSQSRSFCGRISSIQKQFTPDRLGKTVFLRPSLLLRVVLGIIMILRNKNKGEQDEETIQLYDIFSR